MPGSKSTDDLVLKAIGFLCVVGWSLSVVADQPTRLSRTEFEDVRDLAADVSRASDGKPFHAVSLGKSPTLLLAYFRAADRSSASQLPLTSFRFGQGENASLDEKLVQRLFDHFDRYLPTDAELGGKRLLVMDYVDGGESAAAFDAYFRRYLRERGREVDYRFVALHTGKSPKLPENARSVEIRAAWIRRALPGSQFDDFAPRGDFDVRKHERPQSGSGNFESLVASVRAQMERDARLRPATVPAAAPAGGEPSAACTIALQGVAM